MSHQLKNVKLSRDEKSWEVEVRAEIPAEALAHYREETLKDMQRDAKLDGFRPGKAPIERIVQIYGEPTIQKHAAEHAIEHELPELLAAEKYLIVESPRVQTDVPESGKPLQFTARASLAPEVKLPEYRTIAKKHNAKKEPVSVSDEEHSKALEHLRRERARIDKVEAGAEPVKAADEAQTMKQEELPELDDAFVQSLGYESAEKFSEALKVNIHTQKEMQVREKVRAAILDEVVKSSTIHYPIMLREYELDDMEARLGEDLSRMRLNFDQYLAQVKKTREQIREDWKAEADKRAKVRLILTEIARQEHIEPDAAALQAEFEHAKKHYPQAPEAALRSHISHALRNDAVLRFLEEQK